MSSLQQPNEPVLQVLPPDEALRAARPLPPKERVAIQGVTDDEWAAFFEGLADT